MNPTSIVRMVAFLLSVLLPVAEGASPEPAAPTIYRIGVAGGG